MATPGAAIRLPRAAASAEADRRLQRLRWLAWLLDRSIPVGRWRIGLDPIIGLIPGLGDWLGAVASLYIVYEAARLGMPKSVLGRMAGNILVETIIGAVPVLGDVFDFAWQANARNLQLIDHHYQPALPSRPMRRIWLAGAIFAFVVSALALTLSFFVLRGIQSLFT